MRKSSFLLLLAVLATQPAADAYPHMDRVTKDYFDHMRTMIDMVAAADAQLVSYMQLLANGMANFYIKKGHFPEPGPEQDKLRAAVLKASNGNPYDPKIYDAYDKKALPTEVSAIKIIFLADGTLDKDLVTRARKTVPDSWKAEPGTLVVLCNGTDRFIIWGASADRQPIRDAKRGGAKIIHRHINKELLSEN